MDRYYLDCGYTNQFQGGSWCGGMHTWGEIYDFNVHNHNFTNVLGGEVCMWGEMNNEYNVGTKVFP